MVERIQENGGKYLQVPPNTNNSWYTTQLNHIQQTHKDIPPPLNNGYNISYTTIRVFTKYGQKGHWGVLCTNITCKLESSIDKYTFCNRHHKANTGKLRKKLMTNNGHTNVQYIKGTMSLEEDENNLMHHDLVVGNLLQDIDLT